MAIVAGRRAKPLTLIIGVIVVLLSLLYIGIEQRRQRNTPPQSPPLRQKQ